MSKTTQIITTTTALSSIADDIVANFEQQGSTPSKQSILNTVARGIAGPKHDWGFLTGATSTVIQKGHRPNSTRGRARHLLSHNGKLPALEIKAKTVKIYPAVMANYLASKLSGDFITIAEDFSTDTSSNSYCQCMHEPTAILASGKMIAPKSLWGGTPETVDRFSSAYFAASSQEHVNHLVYQTICDWPDEVYSSAFKAFHMPHAILISTDYPLDTLNECYEIIHSSEDDIGFPPMDVAFQAFIDEDLNEEAAKEVKAQVEDLIVRLQNFMTKPHYRAFNLKVV